ncbi:MAG: porin family protein [Flavobacteriales bacterium]|jgi:hypothetical protein
MKKIISLLMVVAFATPLFAQTKPWKIALHIDPNVSWIKPDSKHITGGDNKINYGFGVSIDKMFTDNYAIGTGFNVINLGGNLKYFKEGTGPGGIRTILELERAYSLKYAEVPITLKLRTNEIGYLTYWAQVGVGLGINIKANADNVSDYKKIASDTTDAGKEIWGGSSLPTEESDGDDIGDDIGIFRTSLIIGGGIEYNLSGDASVVAGILFNNAFSNILKGSGIENLNDEPSFDSINGKPKSFDLKGISNVVSLQIGFLF